ncbi:uncharacterized protein LTR77_008092 [Saxophila tyrrhenica]|uniref:Rhodopsin domain-containing protein n=1 Tax=Saxophila tyrrhenica TaxID=1690608 RepID=A0AAV9P2F3_9PEZI|nr:hypothetical protein LTR77_008092 [Saxophila tyrrhenica]
MGSTSTDRYTRYTITIGCGVIAIWTIFSVLGIAFQCGSVNQEIDTPDRCADGAMWYPVTVTNALTDALLAFSFTPVLVNLSMKRQQKFKLSCLWSIRLLVCVATVAQLVSLAGELGSTDQTRAMLIPVVLQQLVLNLSVLTAIILGLSAFFANLSAGRFGTEINGGDYVLSNASGGMKKSSAGSRKMRGSSKGRSRQSISNAGSERDEPLKIYGSRRGGVLSKPSHYGNGETVIRHNPRTVSEDAGSDRSQENIIRQTVTWEVSYNAPGTREDDTQPPQLNDEPNATRTRNFIE